jgi:hypothetical protein
MRMSVVALMVGLCVAAFAMPVSAKSETITGQVVDLACYSEDKANTGTDHPRKPTGVRAACALACARWEGNPVGLVTTGGKVYQVAGGLAANSNAKIAPHMAKTVTITGDVSEKEGMTIITADEVTTAK